MLHGSATGGALKAANNLSEITSVNTAAKNLHAGYVLAQSAVAVPLTGTTSETTLVTVALPAGAMGANGQIEVECYWSMTNSANNKTPKIKLGATTFSAPVITSVATAQIRKRIANRNAANSQVTTTSTASNEIGVTSIGAAPTTGTEDTSTALNITITGTLALGTETLQLESYRILLFPKA